MLACPGEGANLPKIDAFPRKSVFWGSARSVCPFGSVPLEAVSQEVRAPSSTPTPKQKHLIPRNLDHGLSFSFPWPMQSLGWSEFWSEFFSDHGLSLVPRSQKHWGRDRRMSVEEGVSHLFSPMFMWYHGSVAEMHLLGGGVGITPQLGPLQPNNGQSRKLPIHLQGLDCRQVPSAFGRLIFLKIPSFAVFGLAVCSQAPCFTMLGTLQPYKSHGLRFWDWRRLPLGVLKSLQQSSKSDGRGVSRIPCFAIFGMLCLPKSQVLQCSECPNPSISHVWLGSVSDLLGLVRA